MSSTQLRKNTSAKLWKNIIVVSRTDIVIINHYHTDTHNQLLFLPEHRIAVGQNHLHAGPHARNREEKPDTVAEANEQDDFKHRYAYELHDMKTLKCILIEVLSRLSNPYPDIACSGRN